MSEDLGMREPLIAGVPVDETENYVSTGVE